MAKISEITCDTDLSTFINVGEVEEMLSNIDINEIQANTKDIIDSEMSDGCLNEFVLNIGGYPIVYEKAAAISKQFEIAIDSIEGAKNNILHEAKTHRRNELNQIKNKIDEKLKELNDSLAKFKSDLSNLSKTDSSYSIVQDNITTTQNLINTYTEKRKTVIGDAYYVSD